MIEHVITSDKLQIRIEKVAGKPTIQFISHEGEPDQEGGKPLINPKITAIIFDSFSEMNSIMSTIGFRIPTDINEGEVYEYRIPVK